MSSPAQIAAQRFTGPTSDAGRKIVASNAVKHHFTSKGNPALPGEEDAVEKHVEGYFQTYAPIGTPEQESGPQRRRKQLAFNAPPCSGAVPSSALRLENPAR